MTDPIRAPLAPFVGDYCGVGCHTPHETPDEVRENAGITDAVLDEWAVCPADQWPPPSWWATVLPPRKPKPSEEAA